MLRTLTTASSAATLIGVLSIAALCPGAIASDEPGLTFERIEALARGSSVMTHPRFESPLVGTPDPGDPLAAGGGNVPLPPLSPLATGRYVNFESPPVKALALSADGFRLFVANTPANVLTIVDNFSGAAGLPRIAARVPVGIDPVSVAIQPNTDGRFVWVTNYVSDDVTVVDTFTESVAAVIPVGDEPANIVFDPRGAFAYVVLQGPARGPNIAPSETRGFLVTIDTEALAVVDRLPLDMNTPRAVAFDDARSRIVVAALHSGNNTTLAGEPLLLRFGPGSTPEPRYSLQLLRDFSVTSAAFAASPLAPWPDPSAEPNPPFVPRIVDDAGIGGAWAAIVDPLTLPDGSIDPAVAAAFSTEFGGVTNAFAVLRSIVDDVKDTLDHDLAVIDALAPSSPTLVRYIEGVGTTLAGMALLSGQERLFVTNTEPLNFVRNTPNLRGHIVDHQVVIVNGLDSPTIIPRDLHAGVTNFNTPTPDGAARSLASPMDVVFRSDGTRAYVAGFGPGRIGVLDATTARVLGRTDVGRGPRSLALDDARDLLYVLNRTDMSISRVDVASDAPVVANTFYLFNPEPPVVKNGRDLIYSTRVSANFSSSCATCHIDSTLDHMAWDLSDPQGGLLPAPENVVDPDTGRPLMNHPSKGPMVTMSFRGLADHQHYHWRGDKPTLKDFNEAFDNLLGGRELPQARIDAAAAFLDTIVYPPSPFFERDNSLSAPGGLNGAVLYAQSCAPCHAFEHDGSIRLAGFSDDAGMNLAGLFAQIQIITQLRGIHKKFDSDLYNGFGLIHDGREEREQNGHPLQTFLLQFFPALDAQQRSDMIDFVTAFPTNVMPVVGWQVRAVNPLDPALRQAIDRMIAQSQLDPSQNDVIARGRIAGLPVGFQLQPDPGAAIFRSDLDELRTLDDLLALLSTADELVFEAVPPGSGLRLALDFDSDCILNGFDSLPYGTADLNGDGNVDLEDLAVQLAHFGQAQVSHENGDIDGDGVVTLTDLAALLAVFGTNCPLG